jgi:RNA polymerase sigma factor (sigma-70 family)
VADARYGAALRQIHKLFSIGTIGGLTDGELLERFTSCDHESAELAFAALVERHGPMVLRVCQSILRERHDAEDAFQATFLVLVRKAASIRKQNSVVSWLHGVAIRIARCQKGAAARRLRHEQRAAERPVASADYEDRKDVAAVLHEELDRLPARFRAPIVLCHLESLSHEQAARQLCWPVGTVRSRLARGREQLRSRLGRRGLTPSIVTLKRALGAEAAKAAIPPQLATATTQTALHYLSGKSLATGVASTSVVLLVEGAMNMMLLSKIKVVLLAGGLIATGAFVVAQHAGTARPEKEAPVASVIATENRPAHTAVADDDADVAKELGRLDLDLLVQDVRDLREEVEVALRDKLRAERANPGGTTAANRAFEAARSAYLVSARELRRAQRRLGSAKMLREPILDESAIPSTPSEHRIAATAAVVRDAGHPPAAAIGSIDLNAVHKRCERIRAAHREFTDARLARTNELARAQAEMQAEVEIVSKLIPGSADHTKHENRVTELKARYDAAREQAESEFNRRQAETMATLYKEIQDAVAALAKEKGLTYVVRVFPEPRPDSEFSELSHAVDASVVYADPRNDLTEEVIAELDRRFHAGGRKAAR